MNEDIRTKRYVRHKYKCIRRSIEQKVDSNALGTTFLIADYIRTKWKTELTI